MLNVVVHKVCQPQADKETSSAYARCRAAQEVGPPASTTTLPYTQMQMEGSAGRLHQALTQNMTCHFNSSPPPPLSLQTVKWRGIQESVGVVYRVDEQCGMAGELRCVNFMPSFFLVTHPPIPNILQMNARIFIAHLHLHLLHLSLPKTSGRVLHHWPSPSHCSCPSNKCQDNTVNNEHGREHM